MLDFLEGFSSSYTSLAEGIRHVPTPVKDDRPPAARGETYTQERLIASS